jgi:hypothetical protein
MIAGKIVQVGFNACAYVLYWRVRVRYGEGYINYKSESQDND